MDIHEVNPDSRLWPEAAELFPESVDWLKSPDDDGNYRFFAAVDEKNIFLGGGVIEISTMGLGPLSDVKAAFLEGIEVLKPYRRNGVGRALLLAMLDAAWKAGCESVRSTVEYKNHAALQLYRTTGFGFVPAEDPDAAQPDKVYSIVVVNPDRIVNLYKE